MTIDALIDDLSTDGIVMVLHKGQIKASGPSGAINSDVVARLRSNKPAIIKFLINDLLVRAVATVPGVSAEDLRANLDPEDWQDGALITYEPLKALGYAIRNTRAIAAGHVPDGWTETTQCSNCSTEVPTFPGGSDFVLACPWCMNGQTSPLLPGHDQ